MSTIRTAPPKSGHVRISQRALTDIRPSPENDRLYSPVREDDPAIQQLADSIRQHGVKEPLVVTRDGFILSGHRRYAAARLAGLRTVPCRVEPISRMEDPDRFLVLLREYNRQREKSLDEKLREAVVTASPDEAYQSLIEHRERRSQIDVDTMEVGLDPDQRRARISQAKQPFLQAIGAIIERLQEFWPLSDRQIHYQLLNSPPLIHASKPGSVYRNTIQSYKALVDLLTRARLVGRVPWAAIADETRPVSVWNVHRDPQTFIEHELNEMLTDYWRDLMQSQPNHVEIIGEKNTIAPIIQPVAAQYCIPMTIGRGFCSLPPRHAMAQRFRASGRQRLIVLILSDFDPDGQMIAQSFIRSMIRDFGIGQIEGIKVALTAEQVERFALPPQMKAKASSTNYRRFVQQHGEDVYELEALEPGDLQQQLRDAIDSVLDVQAFNHELDREREDAAFIENARRRVHAALTGIVGGGA